MHYSNLTDSSNIIKHKWVRWENPSVADSAAQDEVIEISETTFKRRRQMYGALDKFSTFSWDNQDAFRNYGAFIINEKREDLKFYNGPSFSNEYSSPQFSTFTNLSGITFKTQQISFKIGVYWITIEDYRRFLNWLNPYTISNLVFSFNSDYCYQVKLASIADSIRYVIGSEGTNPCYYTEMTLTFDIQGEPCARKVSSLNLTNDNTSGSSIKDGNEANNIYSDLDTPFKYSFKLSTAGAESNSTTLELKIKKGDQSMILFTIGLQNLYRSDQILDFEYDSQSGLVYYQMGVNDAKQVLNKLNNINGQQLVRSLTVNKMVFPGRFTTSSNIDSNIANYTFELTSSNAQYAILDKSIECYLRTNII